MTFELMYFAINGSSNNSCIKLTIAHAPCAEEPLISELENASTTPVPVIDCIVVVAAVAL